MGKAESIYRVLQESVAFECRIYTPMPKPTPKPEPVPGLGYIPMPVAPTSQVRAGQANLGVC